MTFTIIYIAVVGIALVVLGLFLIRTERRAAAHQTRAVRRGLTASYVVVMVLGVGVALLAGSALLDR